MGHHIKLKSRDGHRFGAYVAVPDRKLRGAVVILHEIYGVNSHIRSTVEVFRDHGMLAVAPALFDRIEPDVDLGYSGAEARRAISLKRRLRLEDALQDVDAALAYAGQESQWAAAVVGYSMGGTIAWLSATRLSPSAAVCYYGGDIQKYANETPHCPVMLHFGTRDGNISRADVESIQKRHPGIPLYRYAAGHGFDCNQRSGFDEQASAEAFERTLSFLRDHVSAREGFVPSAMS